MRSPRTMLRRARSLSGQERRLLSRAVCLAVGIEIFLRVFPFKKLLAWCHQDAAGRVMPSLQSYAACRQAVDRAYRWIPIRQRCLNGSLVLCRLLRQQGFAAHVRLGVRRERDGIGAHAWVEPGELDATGIDRVEGYLPFPRACSHE